MKLSIVMPSLNQGQFIGAALSSLAGQFNKGNLEVIVKDAKSTDATRSVLSSFENFPFISMTFETDSGQSDALIKGFREATGDILGWLNSDDFLYPGAVEHVLELFEEDPDADVVFGEAVFVDEGGSTVGRFPTAKPSLEHLRHRCVLSQPSVFFRRQCYFAVGGLHPGRNFCMDYELWTKFAKHGFRFRHTSRILSGTRLHAETKTATGGRAFIDEICQMQQDVLGEVSPVWQVYQWAREDALLQIPSKLLRFVIATSRLVLNRMAVLPTLFAAFNERTIARMSASIRHAFGQS